MLCSENANTKNPSGVSEWKSRGGGKKINFSSLLDGGSGSFASPSTRRALFFHFRSHPMRSKNKLASRCESTLEALSLQINFTLIVAANLLCEAKNITTKLFTVKSWKRSSSNRKKSRSWLQLVQPPPPTTAKGPTRNVHFA